MGKADEFIGALPVRFREDATMLAIMRCYGNEFDRLEAKRVSVEGGLVTPARADESLIGLWEELLGLDPVAPGASLATRQGRADAYLLALRRSGTGTWWEETLQRIAPGASYVEAGGGVVNVELPFAASTASFTRARLLIERVTDAHLTLNFTSSLSFRLDVGKLDDDTLP